MLERIAPGATGDFIDRAHHSVFGAPVGLTARRRYAALLETEDRRSLVTAMLRDPRHAERVAAEFDPGPGLSDEAFLSCAYRELLERDLDPEGRRIFTEALADGSTRTEVVRLLARSDEYVLRAVPRYFPLVDLRALHPERYQEVQNLAGDPALVYRAEEPDDFDWIESAILEGGYYDRPGVWHFEISTDKRLMAELVGALEPGRVLELGCASGPVLQCLHETGLEVEGVEISRAAIDAAFPEVRDRIHQVDATAFDLSSSFDVIVGLDIFEHLNPARLADCLRRVEAHLNPGGYVFCNIPAFGPDAVFGQVFEVYLRPWLADCEQGRNFRTLHADDLGYPHNGHLIWAHTDWWVERFESVGLRRETGIERALHARYDAYLARATPARRSFYIFSKAARPGDAQRIEASISASGSAVLAALESPL
jgi:SAM-dependent methyltransferase